MATKKSLVLTNGQPQQLQSADAITVGINNLTTEGSPDSANDYILLYDASSGTEKKATPSAIQGSLSAWATSSLASDSVTLVNRTAFYRTLSGNSTLSFSGVAEGGEYRFYFTASGANRDVIIPSGHYTPGGQKTFTIESGNTLPMELFYVNSIYMWTIGAQIKA